MADQSFQEVGGALASRIFGGVFWVGIAIIAIALVGGLLYYFLVYKKKFDIRVKIRSKRAEDPRFYFDKAAILYDKKDKNNYLRLFNSKYDLPIPPYGIIQRTNEGDYLELSRESEDEFIFLDPGRIDNVYIRRHDGKKYKIGTVVQTKLEGDIAYWNVKRKERNRGLFNTESLFMKLLPFLPQLLGGVFMIFILYVLLDSLPGLISQLTELARALSQTQQAQVIMG